MSVTLGMPGIGGPTQPAPGSKVDRADLDEAARVGLGIRLEATMRGDVAFDGGTRAAYASDSSNYRQVPLGVVFPRDTEDMVTALAACRDFGAPVTARGAGTGLAGQTCNVAVVIDTSRHLREILQIDPDRRIARVQPGVILDDLRDAAEEFGLTFGPDPATHAWCTIGGMIGNNSCGAHGLYAGKTVDNVESMSVLTYEGDRFEVGPTHDDDLAAIIAAGGRRGAIYESMARIRDQHLAKIRGGFPDIPRRVSGYNLDELLPEHGFDVARALVGSEGTCALVTEATLRLVTSPKHRRLVVLGYPDIFLAADNVPALLECKPLGLECIDQVLVDQTRRAGLNLDYLPMLPDGGGWLLAEVGSDDPAEADAMSAELAARAPGNPAVRRYDDPRDAAKVMAIRESGLGATAKPPGETNHEGWEDAGVPPARLGEYLRRLVGLWDDFGFRGALYGHAGQGCIHTRNNFDLHTTEGLGQFRRFLERAADLVVSVGGSISGEHGDGQARGELLSRMYDAEMIEAFRAFKTAWDPHDRMNPGKLVDAFPLDTNLRHGPDYHPDRPAVSFAYAEDAGDMSAAVSRCVGVGRCRRFDTGVMCPSYRATRDERHSTRGRAKMLEEMFRGEVTENSWRNEDVKDALDLCLSCKGCKVDCPTHVDMATYKAEFLSHYYRNRPRPRADYALGLLPWVSRLATGMPRTANLITRSALVRRAAGVTTSRPAPKFARRSLRRLSAGRSAIAPTRPAPTASADVSPARVVLWPDSFTDAFSPDVGRAAVDALTSAGFAVDVPTQWACCGRTLYDSGMLDRAKKSLSRLMDVLEPFGDVPIVVAEPSCLATFRDELPSLLASDPRAASVAGRAVGVAEALTAAGSSLPRHPSAGVQAVVQPHCQGRSVGATKHDAAVLAALGFEVSVLDAGCCGLAGSFGFNAEHADVSRQIAELGVLPALADVPPDAVVVADGFSCATQIEQLAGRPTKHLAELVAEAFASAAPPAG
ncbi:MAG: FAD-binding and (Fe-S)-binding domain-containing protein [Mycobacteriales bacterium]